MNFEKIAKKFNGSNINWWLTGGTFGKVISIVLFPLTIIKAIILALDNRRLSYDAYEKIVDAEIVDIERLAYSSFGLARKTELINISLVAPCYEAIGSEPVLLREVKTGYVQSTCIEATELILDGVAVRIFCRRFSTVSPVFRDSAITVFVKDIISVALVSEVKQIKKRRNGALYFEDKLMLKTKSGDICIAVSGDRQDSNTVFLQVDKYFSAFKKALMVKDLNHAEELCQVILDDARKVPQNITDNKRSHNNTDTETAQTATIV